MRRMRGGDGCQAFVWPYDSYHAMLATIVTIMLVLAWKGFEEISYQSRCTCLEATP